VERWHDPNQVRLKPKSQAFEQTSAPNQSWDWWWRSDFARLKTKQRTYKYDVAKLRPVVKRWHDPDQV
jgi:hypothetical protein